MPVPELLRQGVVVTDSVLDVLASHQLDANVAHLLCTREQSDVATIELLAHDLNDGAPIDLAYCRALKTLDSTARTADPGNNITAAAAPQTLDGLTAEAFRVKLRAAVRDAVRIAERAAALDASVSGTGADQVAATARAIGKYMGKEEEDIPMEMEAAKGLYATAEARGVHVPYEDILKPGPIALTKIRKATMSTRPPNDPKTKPRYPSAMQVDLAKVDSLDAESKRPYEAKMGSTLFVEKAQAAKLL